MEELQLISVVSNMTKDLTVTGLLVLGLILMTRLWWQERKERMHLQALLYTLGTARLQDLATQSRIAPNVSE